MRKVLLSACLAIGVVMLLSGTPSFAVVPQEMHVTIPFAFHVGDRLMPAGRYVITSPGIGNLNLLMIRDENGSPSVFVMTQPLNSRYDWPTKPDLIFKKINGVEYLAQIWANPGDRGNAVPLPDHEFMSVRAAMNSSPTVITPGSRVRGGSERAVSACPPLSEQVTGIHKADGHRSGAPAPTMAVAVITPFQSPARVTAFTEP